MSVTNFVRSLFVKVVFAPKADLTGKYAIVTGASPGSLGFETAKTLARWGATVVITTRSNTSSVVIRLKHELAIENNTAQIDGHELDLCDADSVDDFADWYRDQYSDGLHILINNAGVHMDLMSKWKDPMLTGDGHEIQWRTNYLGTVHLTHRLLPLLCKTGSTSGDVRVVNVGSQVHTKGSNAAIFDPDTPYDSWQSYGTSKLAMIHHAFELQRRFINNYNLKGYCLHPGGISGVRTNITDNGLQGHKIIIGLKKALGGPVERLFIASTEEGAQTQIFCATSPDAKGGQYYQGCVIKKASPDAYDEKAAKRLWRETIKWIEQLPRIRQ